MLGRNLSLFSGNSDEGPVLRRYVEGDSEDRRGRFKRSQDHHELYQKLIRWELDDELYATEKRLRDWSRERLVSNGLALFDPPLRSPMDGFSISELSN